MQIKNSNPMGKVFATLTIVNRADQIRAEDGTISPEEIRSIVLNDVLVDSGATTLCLPKNAGFTNTHCCCYVYFFQEF